MLKDLVIGGGAGIISRTLTAPLELYKIQCQNRYMKDSTLKNVVKKEGIRYLWKGNGTNSIRVFPQFAINYAVFEFSKNNVCNQIKHENTRNFLSGGLAGIVAMICIYPLETIRTRVSLQMCHSHYTSPYDAFLKMSYRDLYKGLGVSMCGFGPFSAFNFAFYHYFKNTFTMKKYNETSVKLLSGGFSGIAAISITYPTDLIRRRLQMQGFDTFVPKYK